MSAVPPIWGDAGGEPAPAEAPLIPPASLSLPPLPPALRAYLKPSPAATPPPPAPVPPEATAPPPPPPPPPLSDLMQLEAARRSLPGAPALGDLGLAPSGPRRPGMGPRQAEAAARASRNVQARAEGRRTGGQPPAAGAWPPPAPAGAWPPPAPAPTTLAALVAAVGARQRDHRPPGQPNGQARAVERALARARTMPDSRRSPPRSWDPPRANPVAPPAYASPRATSTRWNARPTGYLSPPARPPAEPPPSFLEEPHHLSAAGPAPARAPALAPAAGRSEDVFAIGLVAACIVVLELIGAVAIIAVGGPGVLGFGLALDAAARGLGTMAAIRANESWGAGWPWASALVGSPAVLLFAFNADGSFTDADLAPTAGPLAIAAILALVFGLAGLPVGI